MQETASDFQLAIVDHNTLTTIGLKSILEDLLPQANIVTFTSFSELVDYAPYTFVHYFVSTTVYFAHIPFFHELGHRVVLLVEGDEQMQRMHLPCIDLTRSEHEISHQILSYRDRGRRHDGGRGVYFHGPDFGTRRLQQNTQSQPDLSAREVEVLRLMVLGQTSREIANSLSISTTTVISHRRSIQQKTAIRSLSRLTVYAILNGYVKMEEV